MTCHACAIAETKPDTGHVHADCQECAARSIARSYGGMPRERIVEAMRRVWPDEADYREGRIKVWKWFKRLQSQA